MVRINDIFTFANDELFWHLSSTLLKQSLGHFRPFRTSRLAILALSYNPAKMLACLVAVWQDAGVKRSQIFPKVAQNSASEALIWAVMFFKLVKKLPNILATFVRKFVIETFKNSPITSHCLAAKWPKSKSNNS